MCAGTSWRKISPVNLVFTPLYLHNFSAFIDRHLTTWEEIKDAGLDVCV